MILKNIVTSVFSFLLRKSLGFTEKLFKNFIFISSLQAFFNFIHVSEGGIL